MSHLWIDAQAGVAGDMLLGALLDAGASHDFVTRCVAAVSDQLRVRVEPTTRHQLAATKATIIDTSTGRAADEPPHQHGHEHDHAHGHDHGHEHRPWRVVRDMVAAASLPAEVEALAQRTFEVLARAEGRVHGIAPEDVEFHEVGSLDAIGDVVGTCAALASLAPTRTSCSVVTVGFGDQVSGAHGRIPIPGPALTHVATEAGIPIASGPLAMETATPTGMALLAALCDEVGTALPPMVVEASGLGAGTRDPQRVANVVRVILGRPVAAATATDATPTQASHQPSHQQASQQQVSQQIVLSTNVDDLDPRLWPGIIEALMEAGAADAWLAPILMKKGRPAHTLHVLTDPSARDAMIDLVATHTSAIGLRESTVTKHALAREFATIDLDGHRLAVKIARHRGRVVNVSPEFRDVRAYAHATGTSVKQALGRAIAACEDFRQA